MPDPPCAKRLTAELRECHRVPLTAVSLASVSEMRGGRCCSDLPKASRLASCRAGPPTGLILPQSLHCATSYLGLTRSEPSSKLGAQNPCLTGLNESGLGVAFNIWGVPLPALSSPPVIGYLQPFPPSQNDRCLLAAEPQRPSQGPRGRAGSRGPARSWLSLGCPGAGGQDVPPGSRHSWSKVAGSGRFIISGNPVTQVPGR